MAESTRSPDRTRWTPGGILVGRRSDRKSLSDLQETLFLDSETAGYGYQRFGLLLVLSAIIASGGIVADSTATVIGAMIVAPLGQPIMAVALATVIGSGIRLRHSVAAVLLGAAGAAFVGALMSVFIPAGEDVFANPQITGRINPSLVDLIVALAVGFVAAVGLMRQDLSDVLPGVAIAISLVPPMCVVGILMAERQWAAAFGAFTLFGTNVLAMILAGILTYTLAGYSRAAVGAKDVSRGRVGGLLAVAAVFLLLPLAWHSLETLLREEIKQQVNAAADSWTADTDYVVTQIDFLPDKAVIQLVGNGPPPDPAELAARLDGSVASATAIQVDVLQGQTVTVGPGGGTPP